MEKDFQVKNLDKTTLKFAIEKAWSFGVLCKETKEGRIQAKAFNQVQSILEHFLQEVENLELVESN